MQPTDTDITNWSMLALSPASWLDIVLNFGVALVFAFVINIIYRLCRGVHATRSFLQTLYMLTFIITLVIMVILSVRGAAGVAVAFGLMGALSIIRFRTIVKDNRDTAFVFLAVGAGMAAGAGVWLIGFIGIAVIGLTLLLIETAPWHGGRRQVVVKIRFRPSAEGDQPPHLLNALKQFGSRVNMLHVRTLRLGELLEATYSMALFHHIDEASLIAEMLKTKEVEDLSVFNAEELEEP